MARNKRNVGVLAVGELSRGGMAYPAIVEQDPSRADL